MEIKTENGTFAYDKSDYGLVVTECIKQAERTVVPSKIAGEYVTEIAGNAFFYCREIKELIIEPGIEIIGENAFTECSSLCVASLPDSVAEIGEGAFAGCSSLTEITLPAELSVLPPSLFAGCGNLQSIYVPATSEDFSSVDGVLTNKSKTVIVLYPTGREGEYKIPDGVYVIGEQAFAGCDRLTAVTMPDSVKEIYDEAFLDCNNLQSVTLPDNLREIGNDVFYNCDNVKVSWCGRIYEEWEINELIQEINNG